MHTTFSLTSDQLNVLNASVRSGHRGDIELAGVHSAGATHDENGRVYVFVWPTQDTNPIDVTHLLDL